MSAASWLGSFEEVEARYSCVFPPGDEPDPAIVRAIRGICPNFVPLWVARAFKTPSEGRHVAKYHVLGTWQPYPSRGPAPVRADRPYFFKFRGGVIYAQRPWSIAWPDKSWQKDVNFPEQGLPFDHEVYWFVKQVYGEHGVPFGTRLEGEMGSAGREHNANEAMQQEVKRAELRKVQENARLELRSRMSNSPTAMKSFEEWKDAMANNRPEVLYKRYEPKGFSDQAATPEPPAVQA